VIEFGPPIVPPPELHAQYAADKASGGSGSKATAKLLESIEEGMRGCLIEAPSYEQLETIYMVHKQKAHAESTLRMPSTRLIEYLSRPLLSFVCCSCAHFLSPFALVAPCLLWSMHFSFHIGASALLARHQALRDGQARPQPPLRLLVSAPHKSEHCRASP
jgi:hypothetical protein